LAADETVEDKAGKQTYSISMFYFSIAQKAIHSISFLAMSIIDIEAEKFDSVRLYCQGCLIDRFSR
jgi:hypothetical protein